MPGKLIVEVSNIYWSIMNQKSEHTVPIFDRFHYFNAEAGRVLFFRPVSGVLFLRASCFMRLICLRLPWEARLSFFFSGNVSIDIAPF